MAEMLPGTNPLAVDLLEKMLVFNPERRISVDDALAHPYLSQLHNPEDEPECQTAFNFDFERQALDQGVDIPKEELQQLILDDMQYFQCLYSEAKQDVGSRGRK